MCGIAGIAHWSKRDFGSPLKSMVSSLIHRGPDGRGFYSSEGVALGHTRLSIVDLEGGAQPMLSAGNRFCVTFNGEIYGYERIKNGIDYPYQSNSDTEVLLALYQAYGPDMLKTLPGMFAFAIWDSDRKILFCARDRFGEKPFYYALGENNEFIFSSEIKAIIASGLVRPEIDPESVTHFFRKLYVNPSRTIYKNIHTLNPGCCLQITERGIVERSYWDFPETNGVVSIDDAMEELESKLGRAIKDQLVADVPVGAFLSGGLDSSSIVASAVHQKSDLMTLSYRFRNGFDEGRYAKDVSDLYRTKHIEMFEGDFSLRDTLLLLSKVYDEPFADSSSVPTYLICREARKHCKVVLTGDGADELFGGYAWKYRPFHFQLGVKGDKPLRLLAGFLVNKLLAKLPNSQQFSHRAVAYKNEFSGRSLRQSMDELYVMFSDLELSDLGLRIPDVPGGPRFSDFNQVLKEDMSDYMAGDILVKTDRASMANGLELRSPFLDWELAEYVMSLPGRMKVDAKSDKILLRETFGKKLPESVTNRSKQGFGSPISKWLSLPEMVEAKEYYFSGDRRISKYVDMKGVSKFKDGDDERTWSLLLFSMWCETWEA